MVYSTAGRVQEELHEARTARAGRAIVISDGKRMPIGPGGAVIGRSRDCDIVLQDSNVSRRHAEIRPDGVGWTIVDLDSTNGIEVDGKRVKVLALTNGAHFTIGTTEVSFSQRNE